MAAPTPSIISHPYHWVQSMFQQALSANNGVAPADFGERQALQAMFAHDPSLLMRVRCVWRSLLR